MLLMLLNGAETCSTTSRHKSYNIVDNLAVTEVAAPQRRWPEALTSLICRGVAGKRRPQADDLTRCIPDSLVDLTGRMNGKLMRRGTHREISTKNNPKFLTDSGLCEHLLGL